MDAPAELAAWVPSLFDDPTRPLYAQAATVAPDGAPDVRTVHLRYARGLDALVFACHTGSPKWAQLKADPRLKLAFFHPKLGLQLRLAAAARLVDAPGDAARAGLWAATDEWLRAEYWGRPTGLGAPPPAFGLVVLEPSQWDAYRVDPARPANNERTVFLRAGGAWRAEPRKALL